MLKQYRQILEEMGDLDQVLKAFKALTEDYKPDLYTETFESRIDFDRNCWRDDGISDVSRRFLVLYVLLVEKNDGSLITRLNETYRKINGIEESSSPSNIRERACLQIIIDDGRLPNEVVFKHAFLRFDGVQTEDEPGTSSSRNVPFIDNILRRYEKGHEGNLKGLTVEFSPVKGRQPILEFIKHSEKVIAERRGQGYSVEPRLWIEIFLPRKRLLERVDTWQEPVTEKVSRPLNRRYKIVFCSLERLKDASYLLSLQDTCERIRFSIDALMALPKVDNDIETILDEFDDKVGILCPLERLEILKKHLD